MISDTVRSQLFALGIPGSEHTAEALEAFFPAEFNIRAADMSLADLASVLVYLASHGVVSVDPTLARTVTKPVRPGWHFCQFYRDDAELLAMVAPYIAGGLRNGEGCLWVMPASVTSDAACDALGRFLVDVDRYRDCGQLELLAHPDWYLDNTGQLKSFEQISEALVDRQDRAVTKGFKFLRAAGDAGWISKSEQSKNFIDYEMKVNAAIGATQIAAVCTYRADVAADELIAIVRAHQDALCQIAS